MATYIVIAAENEVSTYATDTDEEIADARAALREAGLESARVYVGDPEDPSSYVTDALLFAEVSR